MNSRIVIKLVLGMFASVVVGLLWYGFSSHQSPVKLKNDNLETINIASYLYGKTPPISIGAIENSGNAYIHLKLRFRADSTEGFPNIFQTAAVNSGMRMEIVGSYAGIVVPDATVPGGLKGITITTDLEIGKWYELEVKALNGAYVRTKLNGHNVDFSSAGLSMATSQLLVGGGFDASRKFRGKIEAISVTKGNLPPLDQKNKRIIIATYSLLMFGLFIIGVMFFLIKKKYILTAIVNPKACAFVAAVMLFLGTGFFYYIFYLAANGYLPSPFIYMKSETFMDLFNVMYWAYDNERYTRWGSVYPPINFFIMKFMNVAFVGGMNGYTVTNHALDAGAAHTAAALMRMNGMSVIIGFCLMYIAIPIAILNSKLWCIFTKKEKLLIYFAVVLSAPMLFTLERGNLILFAPLLLAFMLSNTGIWRSVCIALMINLKPYFVLLLIFYIVRRDWKGLTTCVAFSGIIFMISGLALDSHFLVFFSNMFNFSQGSEIFHFKEVMALPSSISAFSYVLKYPEGSLGLMKSLSQESMAIISHYIDALKWCFLAVSLALVLFKSKRMRDVEIFALLVIAISNLGIWVGGYTFIFYIALIPVLFEIRAKWIFMSLLALIAMPLDLISLERDFLGEQYSYFTGTNLDIQWTLGLGSLVRPIANMTLLVVLAYEFSTRPVVSYHPDNFELSSITVK
jgi:hypothetical protein